MFDFYCYILFRLTLSILKSEFYFILFLILCLKLRMEKMIYRCDILL